jgi:hypothetical protein
VTQFAHQRSGIFTHCSLINMLHSLLLFAIFLSSSFFVFCLSLIISSTFPCAPPPFSFLHSRFVPRFFLSFFLSFFFLSSLTPRFLCLCLYFITLSLIHCVCHFSVCILLPSFLSLVFLSFSFFYFSLLPITFSLTTFSLFLLSFISPLCLSFFSFYLFSFSSLYSRSSRKSKSSVM